MPSTLNVHSRLPGNGFHKGLSKNNEVWGWWKFQEHTICRSMADLINCSYSQRRGIIPDPSESQISPADFFCHTWLALKLLSATNTCSYQLLCAREKVRTAPEAYLEVSDSIWKGQVWSGNKRTGSSINCCFNLSKASCQLCSPVKRSIFLKNFVKGTCQIRVVVDEFEIEVPNPKKDRSCHRVEGAGQSAIPVSFTGSIVILPRSIIKSRKLTLVTPNSHFWSLR